MKNTTHLTLFINYIVVDCVWEEWIVGECSRTCGGGIQTNTRKPSTTSAHGGKECSGSSNITKSCNTQDCPGACLNNYCSIIIDNHKTIFKFNLKQRIL